MQAQFFKLEASCSFPEFGKPSYSSFLAVCLRVVIITNVFLLYHLFQISLFSDSTSAAWISHSGRIQTSILKWFEPWLSFLKAQGSCYCPPTGTWLWNYEEIPSTFSGFLMQSPLVTLVSAFWSSGMRSLLLLISSRHWAYQSQEKSW